MPVVVSAVVAADGHAFELRRFAPEGAASARLLWLPALGVPAAKYDALAAALAARGIEVVLFEWRGLASSDRRAGRGRDWSYRELLDVDLAATLAALEPGPWLFGGHSLGGQFAALLGARQPDRCAGLVLVAAGVPAPATFAGGRGIALAVLARVMPLMTAPFGYFPGHRLKFAGREAATVMRDWAASARRGGYDAIGDGRALDDLLGELAVPALGLRFVDDWMAPAASLDRLLGKLGPGARTLATLDTAELGVTADHFRWLRAPDAVAARIAAWSASLSS